MRAERSGTIETPMSKAEYEALAAFRYTLRQFLRGSEQRAQEVGLTLQQYLALLAVKGFPGRDYLTIGELAERLQIQHHSAVGLVDRLVAQDLAARQPAETDRRQVFVTLTPRGEEILEKLALANRSQLRRLEPQLALLAECLAAEEEADTPPANDAARKSVPRSRPTKSA